MWGPEEDARHRRERDPAALRRRHSTACPNETRQPLVGRLRPTSSASCPGPTGCTPTPTRPPTRVTRGARRAASRRALRAAPWEREARYAAWRRARRDGRTSSSAAAARDIVDARRGGDRAPTRDGAAPASASS
ncbi:MAG: hypothetical protein MZV64_13950 [Ignavibacteriales bacterium]|nr:hypothetical protein [Ignavibacteriales bacterium]